MIHSSEDGATVAFKHNHVLMSIVHASVHIIPSEGRHGWEMVLGYLTVRRYTYGRASPKLTRIVVIFVKVFLVFDFLLVVVLFCECM